MRNLELVIDDLLEGEEYEFRVMAVNEAGAGEPSEATPALVAKDPYDVPGAPGQPTLSDIRSGAATLNWTRPDSDGGSKITNYRIEVCESIKSVKNLKTYRN